LHDPAQARLIRDALRSLYSAIKIQDAHLRFGFLTGVSKFSKVSLFSGLNNLIDITLDPRYATLCGYTQQELQSVFAELGLYDALEADDPAALESLFHAFFAAIPHDWYRNNQLAGYEGYYASVVYCYFAALGIDLIAEDATSHGRIDLTVRHRGRVWLIEFKVNEMTQPGRALDQLKTRGYAAKYAGSPVTLIGIEFSRESRNLSRFEWERLTPAPN